jgi:hypothetical protein
VWAFVNVFLNTRCITIYKLRFALPIPVRLQLIFKIKDISSALLSSLVFSGAVDIEVAIGCAMVDSILQ